MSSPAGSTRWRACVDTDTHIAFRAYSQHDLEAAFAIGLDSGRLEPASAGVARLTATQRSSSAAAGRRRQRPPRAGEPGGQDVVQAPAPARRTRPGRRPR